MKNRTQRFNKYVRTNIVARLVYRFVCLALIAVGMAGVILMMSYIDRYNSYTKRTSSGNAKVVSVDRHSDSHYEYDLCNVSYEFKVGDKKYSSYRSLEKWPKHDKCYFNSGDTIRINYEKDDPANNAYGDNSLDKDIVLSLAVAFTLIGLVPLGCGFIGLVAIHKAVREESMNFDGEQPASDEQIRLIKDAYKKIGLVYPANRKRPTKESAGEILSDLEDWMVTMNKKEEMLKSKSKANKK